MIADNYKPRVAVIFGGRSSEHSISCVSAGSVIAALDPDRYEVIPIGITKDGHWVVESTEPGHLALGPNGELPSVAGVREVALNARAELVARQTGESFGVVDVVFPVMHGPWGQDGTLQGLLEFSGVRYVGAGVLSSAVGTDKHFMKQLFVANGLPVVPWVLIRPGAWEREQDRLRAEIDALGYPVFVKPTRAGSSFGITRVSGPDQLDAAVREATTFDPKVLVEGAVVGAREVEIGVLQGVEGGGPQTSVIAEITVGRGHAFYDFEAKYLETSYRIPADLDAEVAGLISDCAKRAFTALDVEGLARVDFFALPDGSVIVNEVETMPGFTSTSMFPLLWQQAGVTYPELVDRLVQQALTRSTGLR